MKIIAGLGNPGAKYVETKHNVGFWVMDELAEHFGVTFQEEKWKALVAQTRVGSERVLLLKPLTFMNLSGDSLAEAARYFKELRVSEDIIVIYDDMDFSPGVIKLRETGSAGGHNGIKSIIARLGTDAFLRIRVGIGRPLPGRTVIDHVLSPFIPDLLPQAKEASKRAADAVVYALENNFSAAMNRFNGGASHGGS